MPRTARRRAVSNTTTASSQAAHGTQPRPRQTDKRVPISRCLLSVVLSCSLSVVCVRYQSPQHGHRTQTTRWPSVSSSHSATTRRLRNSISEKSSTRTLTKSTSTSMALKTIASRWPNTNHFGWFLDKAPRDRKLSSSCQKKKIEMSGDGYGTLTSRLFQPSLLLADFVFKATGDLTTHHVNCLTPCLERSRCTTTECKRASTASSARKNPRA